MNFQLEELEASDGAEVYEMLCRIGPEENSFTNPVHGMSYEEFKQWLIEQEKWGRGEDLPQGYVRQSIYWLRADNGLVGVGKIRHALTENARLKGGNVGYAIDPKHRGKGFGTVLLRLLLSKMREAGIDEILLTIRGITPR